MVDVNLEWLRSANGILKILAFIVSVISLGLTYGYGIVTTSQTTINFCQIIIPTTAFILFYFIISYAFDENKPGKLFVMEMCFDVFQAVFNIATGSLMVSGYNNYSLKPFLLNADGIVAAGSMVLILGGIILVDAALLFKNR
uniref:MARVEL domain-containing protein n=1 Tax=Strigamia maritima TaxID=126957 RepID=T1IX83_STRMM